MRDFLHSEIAAYYGLINAPDDLDLAVAVGRSLCSELLEPVSSTFGRIEIRSAFRSCAVNALGNAKRHNCASNESNYARHIWDRRDSDGGAGATACIVVPWFMDQYANGADWRQMAFWIHDHLPYSEAEFFHAEGMCCFGLSWHERPKRTITSWMKPRLLIKNGRGRQGSFDWCQKFPGLRAMPGHFPTNAR